MVVSQSSGSSPLAMVRVPCGSRSTSKTLSSSSERAAPRFIVVVVLPTPPFWLATAMSTGGETEVIPFQHQKVLPNLASARSSVQVFCRLDVCKF